jgi:type II secretory pathway pseudopilin PulG
MRFSGKNKKGFTLTELLFVGVISVMVVAAIISTWVFTYKTWTVENDQTYLRVNLMKALETIKNDVRLSSLTYMVFYPEGSATYTAVSMPVAEANANGFYTLDANNLIVWDKTVIYHMYLEADGTYTLRRTVIDPRDNGLTEEERYDELESVVTTGHGETGTTTDTEFLKNVETFNISSLSSIIDFYNSSATPVRIGKLIFGWVKLAPGDHTLRFQIIGKNSASSGYKIGLDSLMIEPSASVREAEYYSSSYAPSGSLTLSGGTAARTYDPLWSNRNYLEFRATAVGHYIEIKDYYDLWRESAFDNSTLSNVSVQQEEARARLDVPGLGTEDGNTVYQTSVDTGASDIGADGTLPATPPIVLRTVINKSSVTSESDLVKVCFKSSSASDLVINKAYITKREASGSNGLANLAAGSLPPKDYHRHQQLFFKDPGTGATTAGITVTAGTEVWSKWTAFPLRTDSDYLVSMYIENPACVDCKYWQASSSSTRTYYLVGSAYSTHAGRPDWSAATPATSDDVFISAKINGFPYTGTVESQIFDTTVDDPVYNTVGWSQPAVTGTAVKMKVRSSDNMYMAGATDWSGITAITANPAALSVGTGRYVQFQSTLSADPFWRAGSTTMTYAQYIDNQRTLQPYSFPVSGSEYMVTGIYSTWADDVKVDWPGATRICTITGYIAGKNDYGQAKLTVDGKDLVKILSIIVKVSRTAGGKVISAENVVDIEPRNTGK